MRSIYLDYQATSPVHPEVLAQMEPFFRANFGSASSFHQHGLKVRDALAKARTEVAALLNAESPEEIYFTSGGTESANLAVKGAAYASQRKGRHLVISQTEHPAVIQSAEFLEKQGFTVSKVPVDHEGFIDPDEVRRALTDETVLVCVHHANHDLGTIEPVREITAIAAARGIPVFADATASGGWIPINVQELGVSMLSLSPHRFYGPKGVGVLYRTRRARLESIIHGGVQEDGKRAGTENVPAIVGAGSAAELATRQLPHRVVHTATLQKKLWEGLAARVPLIRMNGPLPGPTRLPANLNISIEFVEGEGVVLLMDMQGVAIASGPSCASKAVKIPPVLTAIGLDPALARGNILLSLGEETTSEEIDYVIETLTKVVSKLRAMSPSWEDYERGALDSLIQPRTARPLAGSNSVTRAEIAE